MEARSYDEWLKGFSLKWARVAELSQSLMEDSVKAGADKIPDVVEYVIKEIGEALGETARRHGFIPGQVELFLTPTPFDMTSPHLRIGAKLQATASQKPEEYLAYVSSLAKALMEENASLRRQIQYLSVEHPEYNE
jgi:hypothetical protein